MTLHERMAAFEALIDKTGFTVVLHRDGVLSEEQARYNLSRILEELEELRATTQPTPGAVTA